MYVNDNTHMRLRLVTRSFLTASLLINAHPSYQVEYRSTIFSNGSSIQWPANNIKPQDCSEAFPLIPSDRRERNSSRIPPSLAHIMSLNPRLHSCCKVAGWPAAPRHLSLTSPSVHTGSCFPRSWLPGGQVTNANTHFL